MVGAEPLINDFYDPDRAPVEMEFPRHGRAMRGSW
jgi:hypothetical protein